MAHPRRRLSLDIKRNQLLLTLPALAFLLAAGCAEPSPLLTGYWGGRMSFLAVGDSEAQLQLPCTVVTLPRPALDPAGHFAVTGHIASALPVGQDRGSVFVEGDVAGTDMALAIAYISPSGYFGPVPYTLRRGAVPDFSGVTCSP